MFFLACRDGAKAPGPLRYLIDGYNLMHALGVMLPRFGPTGLRRARTRFLNDLADTLGPFESSGCTVVFDAREPPNHLARETHHKSIAVVFAVDEADADERIEQLIRGDGTPKTLSVVSSDHRLRRAAGRKGARPISSDEFADRMRSPRKAKPPPPPARPIAPTATQAADAREWQAVFGGLDDELAELNRPEAGLTDAEIRRLEREIEEEFRQGTF